LPLAARQLDAALADMRVEALASLASTEAPSLIIIAMAASSVLPNPMRLMIPLPFLRYRLSAERKRNRHATMESL
jgi:hypothetical protein